MQGDYRIEANAQMTQLVMADNFSFDGAPAPWWGFGNQGEEFDRDTMLAELESLSGSQSAVIPASINQEEFDTVILWCRQADVLLGSGAIERMT